MSELVRSIIKKVTKSIINQLEITRFVRIDPKTKYLLSITSEKRDDLGHYVLSIDITEPIGVNYSGHLLKELISDIQNSLTLFSKSSHINPVYLTLPDDSKIYWEISYSNSHPYSVVYYRRKLC